MDYNIANIPVDLILNILNVIIFVVIVRLLVYKPVKKFINERKNKINTELDEASAAKLNAEELCAQYQNKLTESKTDADRIVSDARAEAKQTSDRIISDAECESRRIIDEARAKGEEEKKKILQSVQGEIISASAMMAEKLLERSVSDEDTKRIAEDFFASHSSESKE